MIARTAVIPTSGQNQAEGGPERAFGGNASDLLVAAGRHDEAAFARFYELTSPWIYYLLLRRTGSTVLAEDALCDAYVAVWHRASTFAPLETSALAWATTIALGLVKS